MKTVITMTSWKQRIAYVGFAIWRFLHTQTEKPDMMYLWLAKEEFPDGLDSLPHDLVNLVKSNVVQLLWTEKNEYCHKRWHVYPMHDNDLVISIDDDIYYDKYLIQYAKSCARQYEHLIINISTHPYHPLSFNGINRIFLPVQCDTPLPNMQLCGQCIVLPNSFPLMAYDTKYDEIRNMVSTRCDECWLTPFIVHNNTNMMAHKFKHVPDTISHNETALCLTEGNKKNGQIYNIIKSIPLLQSAWKNFIHLMPIYKYDTIAMIN